VVTAAHNAVGVYLVAFRGGEDDAAHDTRHSPVWIAFAILVFIAGRLVPILGECPGLSKRSQKLVMSLQEDEVYRAGDYF
jgi:hypothetical protein